MLENQGLRKDRVCPQEFGPGVSNQLPVGAKQVMQTDKTCQGTGHLGVTWTVDPHLRGSCYLVRRAAQCAGSSDTFINARNQEFDMKLIGN